MIIKHIGKLAIAKYLPKIDDSDDENVEEDDSEVIMPKVKRKPPLIEDSEIELSIIVEKIYNTCFLLFLW